MRVWDGVCAGGLRPCCRLWGLRLSPLLTGLNPECNSSGHEQITRAEGLWFPVHSGPWVSPSLAFKATCKALLCSSPHAGWRGGWQS